MAKNGGMTGTSPKAQAAAAAYGSVPTKRSITSQYGTQIGNAESFTKALVGLLQQGPSVGAAYNGVVANQGVVDNAAAQRIAAITGQAPQTLGSQAAVGAMGASAMSHLLANQGAARAYGAQLPTIAASRGQLARQTLVNAENQALQQRADAYRQSYVSALSQARQNAFSQRMALADLGLKRQSLAEQQRQFNAGQAYRYAALNENRNQFNRTQAQQFQEFQQNLQAQIRSGGGGGGGKGGGALSGFTPNEISSLQNRGAAAADTQVLHGVPIQVAVRNLMAQGIPRLIALAEAQNSYGQATRPTKNQFTDNAGLTTHHFRAADYQAAMRAYNTVIKSFQKWVNRRLYRSTISQQRSQGTAPGQGRGIG